jgi:hypothetical protein
VPCACMNTGSSLLGSPAQTAAQPFNSCIARWFLSLRRVSHQFIRVNISHKLIRVYISTR